MCFSPEKGKLFTKSRRRKIGKWIRNKKISIGSIKQRRFVTDFSSKKKAKNEKQETKEQNILSKRTLLQKHFQSSLTIFCLSKQNLATVHNGYNNFITFYFVKFVTMSQWEIF